MKIRQALRPYVSVSKEVLGGTPVFKGTRVPVRILFDYLLGGDSIEEFVDNYPSVGRDRVQQLLKTLGMYVETIEESGHEVVA